MQNDIKETVKPTDRMDVSVTRGKASWDFIYIFLGFTLSFEGTLIQLIQPLCWPCNLILYVIAFMFTVYLFLFNGWFQNKLILMRNNYENTSR
jgi:hypothetical protein